MAALLVLSTFAGIILADTTSYWPRRDLSSISTVSEANWAQLNGTVGGRLYRSRPYNGPCYTRYDDNTPAYNAAECQAITGTSTQAEVLIQDFGSYVNPSFGSCLATGQKCTIHPGANVTLPMGTCYQGAVPPVYVDVRNVSDVQSALRFASRHKLPVTVKNTGHDYRGYSAAPDTLAIWTHNLNPPLQFVQDFTPAGCSAGAGPAVTYGAGATFDIIYAFLAAKGYILPGGTCPSVGAAGGYIAGGGYGILTPDYGLAVDNALEMKVVLPNGTFAIANRCQNRDLFFALRGGGGGTFGVVTEVTSKAIQDNKPLTVAVLAVTVPDPRPATEIFVNNTAAWIPAGWTGSVGVREGNAASVIGINTQLTISEARQSLKPVADYFRSVANATNIFTELYLTFPTYASFQLSPISIAFAARGIGNTTITASRLIPRRIFGSESSRKSLVDVLIEHPYGAMLTPPYRFTLPSSDLPGGPGHASVTPAWREAAWHLVHRTIWDPADPVATTPTNTAQMFKALSRSIDSLRALTPDSGAYMNEGDTYEPDAPGSFWGQANYQRLLAIKKRVDPDNLLSCLKCVGADNSAPRNRCYPRI